MGWFKKDPVEECQKLYTEFEFAIREVQAKQKRIVKETMEYNDLLKEINGQPMPASIRANMDLKLIQLKGDLVSCCTSYIAMNEKGMKFLNELGKNNASIKMQYMRQMATDNTLKRMKDVNDTMQELVPFMEKNGVNVTQFSLTKESSERIIEIIKRI